MITRARWALAVPAVLAGWIGVLAGVMALSDAAPAALVLFPSRAFLASLPPEAAILSQSPVSVTIAAAPGITPALYRAGAHLVLPAGLKGCSPV